MSNKKEFLLSALAVIGMSAVMLFTESKAGGESGIIVKLELASSIHEIEMLVAKYDEEHIGWLRLNTLYDFVFILTYTSLFFFTLQGLAFRFSRAVSFNLLLFAACIPGILDVVENIFILVFLSRNFSTPYFDLYYWCVHFKWFLVAIYVILALIQLGWIIYEKYTPATTKAG